MAAVVVVVVLTTATGFILLLSIQIHTMSFVLPQLLGSMSQCSGNRNKTDVYLGVLYYDPPSLSLSISHSLSS